MKVTIREYEEEPSSESLDAGASFTYEYVLSYAEKDNSRVIEQYRRPSQANNTAKGFLRVMTQLFLPIGFPHSVDDSYLPYQLYDGLQGLCSYWRGVVATKAVLEAAGVGNAEATAMSAAMNWALRDGTGMVGGLVFSYCASHLFDTHVKEFRLFADIINDVALTLDMLAPTFGTNSFWILSLSTICKTMCGMSAGATKGRITHHFSRHGNMADLSAKESTQETLVSLLGMIGGVVVAHLLQHAPHSITWTMFGFLTYLHVWANYKAVNLLKLATLNPERTHLLLGGVLQALVNEKEKKDLDQALSEILTPKDINESVLSSTKKLLFPTLHMDRPLQPQLLTFLSEFSQEKYVIGVKGNHLYAWLRVSATYDDELQAYLHALMLEKILFLGKDLTSDVLARTLGQVRQLFQTKSSRKCLMERLKEKGWDLESRLYLGFSSRRIHWKAKEH